MKTNIIDCTGSAYGRRNGKTTMITEYLKYKEKNAAYVKTIASTEYLKYKEKIALRAASDILYGGGSVPPRGSFIPVNKDLAAVAVCKMNINSAFGKFGTVKAPPKPFPVSEMKVGEAIDDKLKGFAQHLIIKTDEPVKNTGHQIIYCSSSHGKMGEVRARDNGMVAIFLDAAYWPEDKRDDKKGKQYMGDFHTFNTFKLSGSFDDLTLIEPDLYIDYHSMIPIFP